MYLRPYKGFQAVVHKFSVEENLIGGSVTNIGADVVRFYANTPVELQKEFEISVDCYLENQNG